MARRKKPRSRLGNPVVLDYSPPDCLAGSSHSSGRSYYVDGFIPEPERGRADRSADTKKKKRLYVPQNKDVLKLAQKLERDAGNGLSQNKIALEFTEGDKRRASSLLKGVWRYRQSLK
jgi:hypothetical protein